METQEKFLWGAIIGTAIGAAAALILTPFSGVTLRKKIIKGVHTPQTTAKRKTAGHARRAAISTEAAKKPLQPNIVRKTNHREEQKSHHHK